MKWIKKGLIFEPKGNFDWMLTHAMMPCVLQISDDIYRIFFSGRDSKNRSQGGYMDININNPTNVLNFSEKPVLKLGPLGCFDDSGAMPTCIVNYNDKLYMYYNGWTLGKDVPFFSFNGVAVSADKGNTFKKLSPGPIVLYRNDVDPYSTFAPYVIIENGIWKMWYVSCVGWKIENDKPKHYYHIKYAESKDGINWDRRGIVCIDFKSKDEYAIARPCVIKEDGIYKMWYSYRGGSDTYRIGYAESTDRIKWERKDEEAGIDVSESGWDSEMICYAFVFEHKGKKYMLYNGNSYGKTGVGYAILKE